MEGDRSVLRVRPDGDPGVVFVPFGREIETSPDPFSQLTNKFRAANRDLANLADHFRAIQIAIAASRILLWLPSGWECRGRRLSRG